MGCSERIQRDLCAHTASHAGRSCSPQPLLGFLLLSSSRKSNFSGIYAAALCTMLLLTIKFYFLTAAFFLAAVGRCGTLQHWGWRGAGYPCSAAIPAGPHGAYGQPLEQPAEPEGALFTVIKKPGFLLLCSIWHMSLLC